MKHLNIGINKLAQPLVEQLCAHADQLSLSVTKAENQARIVDAGIKSHGSLEAGRLIAEICLGGLGRVSLTHDGIATNWPLTVHVNTVNPVLACLASQYAGWSLAHEADDKKFQALGSGPARALACREDLFKELAYRDQSDHGVIVLEVDEYPPLPLLDKIALQCGIEACNLTVILTPTCSLAGSMQVVARVLEVALHKVHELGFELDDIVDGCGSAPFPPPAKDFITGMGRTNDAILFAGRVHLFVNGEIDAAESLAQKLPSNTSRDYGRPFAEVFQDYKYDFFKIDPMLFSPAQIAVSHLPSGKTFHAGIIALDLLESSFS